MIDSGTPRLSVGSDCGGVECDGRPGEAGADVVELLPPPEAGDVLGVVEAEFVVGG